MSTFQVILVSVFGFFIIIGLIVFATFKTSSSATLPHITVWGTVADYPFDQAIIDLNAGLPSAQKVSVTYVEKQADTFDNDLIEALASGKGPDVILMPQELLARYEDKITPLPYTSFSSRNFKDAFIDEASLFTTPTGIEAFPAAVDPLMMYWNKDLFAAAGMATPPQYWDQFFTLVPKLTKLDAAGNITQSLTALGEYSNVVNAKAILSAMFLQTGNTIVSQDANGVFSSTLETGTSNPDSTTALTSGDDPSQDTGPESVLRFFTGFSDPSKATTYSWNRSLLDSQDDFIAGNLAVYFGYASEATALQDKNPNLNFDVTMIPQLRTSTTKATFGEMLGFAVLKASPNISGAFSTVFQLTSPAFVNSWTAQANLVPALRSVVGAPPADNPDTAAFYASALVAKGWLDPDPAQTDTIFQTMVESVVSGAARVSDAISSASSQIQGILQSMAQQQ